MQGMHLEYSPVAHHLVLGDEQNLFISLCRATFAPIPFFDSWLNCSRR